MMQFRRSPAIGLRLSGPFPLLTARIHDIYSMQWLGACRHGSWAKRCKRRSVKSKRGLISKAILVLAAVVVLYTLAEVAYRMIAIRGLEARSGELTAYSFSTFDAPEYVLDEQTGFSYAPNSVVHQRLYDRDNNFTHESTIRVNNAGHIELSDDTIAKPEGEFRIAAIGDSFTATTVSESTWAERLEAILNRSDDLKRSLGKKTFKVMNFGLDGTGIVQWPSVYETKVRKYQPDLVIVNFIGNDIFRRFVFRATIPQRGYAETIACTSLPAILQNRDCQSALAFVVPAEVGNDKGKLAEIKRSAFEADVRSLPWVSPRPELLAVVTRGRLGFRDTLEMSHPSLAYPLGPAKSGLVQDPLEAVKLSLKALRVIKAQHPATMILFHPTIEQCLSRETPDAVRLLMEQGADLWIQNMLEALPRASEAEIKEWYNLPADAHPSSYGAEIYARAVANKIREVVNNPRSVLHIQEEAK
jgi:lysophospholipase L1-like esterase